MIEEIAKLSRRLCAGTTQAVTATDRRCGRVAG